MSPISRAVAVIGTNAAGGVVGPEAGEPCGATPMTVYSVAPICIVWPSTSLRPP